MTENSSAVEIKGEYPPNWPDCCPPADAMLTTGTFYRAIENNPATAVDFLNAVEAGKFQKADPCDRLAISLLKTWSGILNSFKLFPHRENWSIATLEVQSSHGKIKETPRTNQPDHVSWWPFQGVSRETAVVKVDKP